MVRMKVARSGLMFSTPTFAKIAVKAAKQADSSAQVCQAERRVDFIELPSHRAADSFSEIALRRMRESASTEYGFWISSKPAMGVLRQHVAVAAGQHHGQAGIALADDAGELDAVHAGHDDVGEDEVDGELVLGQGLPAPHLASATRRTT